MGKIKQKIHLKKGEKRAKKKEIVEQNPKKSLLSFTIICKNCKGPITVSTRFMNQFLLIH